MLNEVVEFLYAPLVYPLDPSRRIFLLFLLTSALMVVIFNLTRRADSTKVPLSSIWHKRLWLHPSSLLDMRVMLLNSLIKGLCITPWLVGKMVVVLAVSGFCYHQFGASTIQMHHGLIVLIFSLTLFVAEDASRFLQHWLMHHVPFLWRIHKVHHQAEVLTPLTLYRIHPIEIMFSSWRSVLVLGTITGFFVYLFPGQVTALEILGVDAFGFLFNALGANLRHSPFPISFGPMNHVFISPLMHQIHHSKAPSHYNKNFGSCLAIWDKLAGSFSASPNLKKHQSSIEFGCEDDCKHTLVRLYSEPFRHLKRPALSNTNVLSTNLEG